MSNFIIPIILSNLCSVVVIIMCINRLKAIEENPETEELIDGWIKEKDLLPVVIVFMIFLSLIWLLAL